MKKNIITGIVTISMLFCFVMYSSALYIDESESIPVQPEKIEYMDERGSIIVDPGAMNPNEGSIVVKPNSPIVITRAKETFPIDKWEANESYTLSSDKEMVYGEKIKVEGSWNNTSARMIVRCSVRRNGDWSAVSQSSFASGSSTTIAVADTGLFLIEAIPSDDITSGSIAISYNV